MQQYIRNLLLPFYAYLGILKKESIAPETGQHIGYTAFPYPICCGKLFSIHHRLRQKKSATNPLPAKGGQGRILGEADLAGVTLIQQDYGLVKSPSVPLGAGLRALSRLWRESFLRNHRFYFLRVHQFC